MERKNSFSCFLFLFIFIGLKLYNAQAASCAIPRGEQYSRAVYRPRYGSNTRRYTQGRRVRSGTKIVITCKEDIYHDLATTFSFSQCKNRRWVPALPQCEVKRRCRAPPTLQYATASERITPYITYPHGTEVRYTCDANKMATGNDAIVCSDGQWTTTNFQCIDDRRIESQNLPEEVLPVALALSSNVPVCEEMVITNGRVGLRENNMYDVTCDAGFRLVPAQHECRDGRWIGSEPQCVPVETDCAIPRGFQYRRSVYRPQTGSSVDNYRAGSEISHGTTIVTICKKDILEDLVTNWTLSACHSGEWVPVLPSCKVKRRCRAPPEIRHATSSEAITPRITFPDGTIVTYTCDVGKMATGNERIVCNDGRWSDTDFHCEAQCKFPSTARRGSVLKLKETGEIINSMYVDHWTQVVQKCRGKSRGAKTRTVRCIYGRWRPSLMTCRPTRRRTSNIRLRTYSSCTIPVMKGGRPARYNNVTSGEEDAFQAGDEIAHGQIVQRVCVEGRMLLPVLQFNASLITVCYNGKWEPKMQRCLQNEKDTVFFDDISTKETTLTKTSTSTATSRKDLSTSSMASFSHTSTKETTTKTSTTTMTSRKDQSTSSMASFSHTSTASTTPNVTTEKEDICSVNPYRCSDGTCISNEKRCDFSLDCADGIDELGCGICGKNQYQCRDGTCFGVEQRCDNFPDCMDDTDEMHCQELPTQTTTVASRPSTTSSMTSPRYSSTVSKTQTIPDIKQDIEYRIHVRLEGGNQLPTYIVLDGTLSKGVRLSLGPTEEKNGLWLYTVRAVNVGKLEKMMTSSFDGFADANVKFVSIYNPDTSGFYIKRYRKYDPGDPQEITGKLCKRQFGNDLHMQPNFKVYKGTYRKYNAASETDCKLRCIEEQQYTCRMAYYHEHYEKCIVLEREELELYMKAPESATSALFKREDKCT